MSDKIKPSEVSQVLLDQLKGISDAEKFDEVGTVLTVSDGVARIYGRPANCSNSRTGRWLS